MKLLEQLKYEHAKRAKATSQPVVESVLASSASPAVLRAIETIYSSLADLVDGLNQLETDARVDYVIESVGTLDDLHQRGYAVLTGDPAKPCFVLAFECVGRRSLTRIVPSVAERERVQAELRACGLGFSVDGMSALRYAIVVRPVVPVRVEFSPTTDGREIRMTAYNLNRLGRELYSIHPDEATEELLEELGKLILRRPSRFAELTGNVVSAETRERLRAQLRSQANGTTMRGHEPPGSRHAERRPLGEALGKRREPIIISHDAQPAGWVDWDGDQAPRRTSDPRTAGAEAPPPCAPTGGLPLASGCFKLVRHAWVITDDAMNSDSSESMVKRGPPGTSQAFPTPVIVNSGEDFRLLDESGKVRFKGMILGKYLGREPLLEFGLQHACSAIEYLRDGRWVRVEPGS